jgi:hypothetical protein
MSRTTVRNTLAALAAAVMLTLGLLVATGNNPFASNQDTKADKGITLIGTKDSGVLVTEQWGKADNGDRIHTGAPTIKVVGTPTIKNLCDGAIAVNNYAADNPESEANYLRQYCNQATEANAKKSTFVCTGALVDLAENVNNGYKGAFRLAGAFTNTTVSAACHDDLALSEYKRLNIGNQPIVTDVS